MAWKALETSLSTKPDLLAGPILRRVRPDNVTVWVALRRAATVTLKVMDSTSLVRLEGTRPCIQIGTNLFITAVTAKLKPGQNPLVEGEIYEYDLEFAIGGSTKTLSTVSNSAVLTYGSFTRPTFCLPPKDVGQLRLIQGSCRIPHGNGIDAFPIVHGLITATSELPQFRPHQLLLNGDQIYADDVAPSMLIMLTEAASVLLGWHEKLPLPSAFAGPDIGNKLPPFMRRPMLEHIGFTSEDLTSHLLTLGEYLCMYLFVWSDVLWPTTLPSFADVRDELLEKMQTPHFRIHSLPIEDDIKSNVHSLESFRKGLKDIRRVLANIPSYMMFDDHEVTDDWNMTLDVCAALYGNETGKRVVQNGLAAYALCQHWGNVPEQFEDTNPVPPGQTLLRLLDGGDAATYDGNSKSIRRAVGMQDFADIKQKKAVFHDPKSLTYNYTIEGDGHQIIVTDSRTWRTFPGDSDDGGVLIPPGQLETQIAKAKPPTAGRLLLVVLSTNAPPVVPIRIATEKSWTSNKGAHFPDIYEAWEIPSRSTDRLYKAITERLPTVNGVLKGEAILLSGDVHTSFASRLLFEGKTRSEDPQNQPKPVQAVFAQLVASSLRKETDKTIGFHRGGYGYSPWYGRIFIPKILPEGFSGWNLPHGTKKKVGEETFVAGTNVGTASKKITGPTTIANSRTWNTRQIQHFRFTVEPDYFYRLDYLSAATEAQVPIPQVSPIVTPGTTAAQRKQIAEEYRKTSTAYLVASKTNITSRQVIGVNNVCEMTLEWPNSSARKVNHTVHWFEQNGKITSTKYVVSFDPADPAFPLLKPSQVP
jgi:hypothetical protein